MSSVSIFRIHREYTLWDAVLPNGWTNGTAILSTSDGDEDNEVIDARDCNKLVLYYDVTMGNSARIDIELLFSDDKSTWYRRQIGTLVGGVNTLSVYYSSVTASGQYRLPVIIMDRYIKIRVRGQGDVTDSNLTAKAFVGTA